MGNTFSRRNSRRGRVIEEETCSEFTIQLGIAQQVVPSNTSGSSQYVAEPVEESGCYHTPVSEDGNRTSSSIVVGYELSEDRGTEIITAEDMLEKYILKKNAQNQCCMCTAAIVSGTQNCGKTASIEFLLNEAVKSRVDKVLTSSKNSDCISCHKVIIFGAYPFKKLTWLMSATQSSDAVMCLLAYFANICKIRNLGQNSEYDKLLEFRPMSAESEKALRSINSEIAGDMKQLYEQLLQKWRELESDDEIKKAMPAGVTLLNIFDVGPSQAARDFIPYLNKYCKYAINIACYNSIRDSKELINDMNGISNKPHYQSKKNQLLRQLCGNTKGNLLVLANTNNVHDTQLKPVVQKVTDIEKVECVNISCKQISNAKMGFEEIVRQNEQLHKALPDVRFIVLFYIIKNKFKSFWMRQSEIKRLSVLLNFDEEDLEKCLSALTSNGNIFYTHDIPSLKEYVIIDVVKFIENLHEIYKSTDEYGLFKCAKKDEEDCKICLTFLETLRLAVEVKSNQILLPDDQQDLKLDELTSYYYIPTAREPCMTNGKLEAATHTDFILPLSLKGYTKEILQVCLCQHFLSDTCFLILTKDINTTAMRFHNLEVTDIEFIDSGNKISIRPMKSGETISQRVQDEIQLLLKYNALRTSLTRQDFVEMLQAQKEQDSRIADFELCDIIHIAKRLAKHEKHDAVMNYLKSKLHLDATWFKANNDLTESEVLTCLLQKLSKIIPEVEFRKELQKWDA